MIYTTPESKLVDKLWKKYGDGMLPSKTFFRAAIIEAMNVEREACAAICDRFQARDVGMQPSECAAAIRARGEK